MSKQPRGPSRISRGNPGRVSSIVVKYPDCKITCLTLGHISNKIDVGKLSFFPPDFLQIQTNLGSFFHHARYKTYSLCLAWPVGVMVCRRFGVFQSSENSPNHRCRWRRVTFWFGPRMIPTSSWAWQYARIDEIPSFDCRSEFRQLCTV